MRLGWIFAGLLVLLVQSGISQAAELRMAVTTSFHNSGLADLLLPEIKADTGIDVRLVIVGTGQALKLGRAGDVDAILVHSKAAEEEFVSLGFGTHRREIMYNDFVLIGPADDPANTQSAGDISKALTAIKTQKSIFVSRGDDSGTHRREMALWEASGFNSQSLNPSWYRAVGSGMGATLNTASGMNAYVLADRASWLNFKNRGDLQLLFSGDPVLFNQYAYLPINPEKHPHVKKELASRLEEWLVSEKGQRMIGDYEIGGTRLFTPNAKLN